MFMDSSQWPQEFELVNYIEGSDSATKTSEEIKNEKPQKNNNNQVVINCPRCNSSNTKFCYYNNYSLTQPRYLCKTCRRYWTQGGTLRNVPVGGVSRKNKKSSSSSSSSSIVLEIPNMPMEEQGHDLNLSFQSRQDHYVDHGILNHGVFGSYVPMPVPESSSMLYSNELKPTTLGDSTQALGNIGGYFGNYHGIVQGNINGRVNLFPFEEAKQHSSTNGDDHYHREQENPCGYWNNGLFGGGTW